MNATQVMASASNAANLLALAGVPIPAPILNTINKALPVVSAVQSIVQQPPQNVTEAVDDLAVVASTIESTGVAAADAEIQAIQGEVNKYKASKKDFESGQALMMFTYTVSVNGENRKAHVATFLDGGPAAQVLGL